MEKSFKEEMQKNRLKYEDLIKRKFIFVQTAEIYGGYAGLYDFGPVGTGIKNNLISQWKKHFIVEEDLLEIDSTCLTPRVVFQNSGHEERFIDWMVQDKKTHDTYRADHLLEDHIENLLLDKTLTPQIIEEYELILSNMGNFNTSQQFDELIERFDIKNPKNPKNKLSKVYSFNLFINTCAKSCLELFDSSIGESFAFECPGTRQYIHFSYPLHNFPEIHSFESLNLDFYSFPVLVSKFTSHCFSPVGIV